MEHEKFSGDTERKKKKKFLTRSTWLGGRTEPVATGIDQGRCDEQQLAELLILIVHVITLYT